MKYTHFIKVFAGMLVLAAFVFAGCESEPEIRKQPLKDRTVLDIIRANGYTNFVEAVELAGLTNEINTAQTQTIFAPNNNAFSVLLQQLGVVKLSEVDPSVLREVLRYHIVTGGTFGSAELPRKIASARGENLYVTGPSNTRSINGKATIVLRDRSGVNGTFHGINTVLAVPSNSIYDQISARATGSPPEFTLLKYALDKAGLDDDLDAGDFTLLAPTNAAFTAAGLGTTAAIDALNPQALLTRLNFHILPAAVFSTDLVTGRVETKNGPIAGQIKGADVAVTATSSSYESGVISNVNRLATNGVWHQLSALVNPKVAIKEGITTSGVNIWTTTNDGLGPDAFGTLVTASGYTRFDNINRPNKDAVYFPRVPPPASSFTNNEAIVDYLERHIFPANVVIPTIANGTKITSVGGDEYYVAVREDGRRFINGISANTFSDQSTSRTVYDGIIYIWGGASFGGLVPLPSKTIVERLKEDVNFTLIAAIIEKTGRSQFLSGGNKTFFAIPNSVVSAETGLGTVAEIQALDPSNDSDLLEELSEVIDRHTVNSVEFAVRITSSVPILKNQLDEDMVFGIVNGDVVIIEDVQDPQDNFAEFLSTDTFLAKNGVVHVIDKVLVFTK